MRVWRNLLAVGAVMLAGRAMGAMPTVGVRMVADVSAMEAGKAFHVAIVVTPEAGWHVYWKNPGDSGLPTKVKWELPAGFEAGELGFPLPEKFVMAGDITAYGYEGETVFLATITPPKELKSGETVAVKGRVSWLCCKEECVPGHQEVALSLPVAEHAAGANEELFAKARGAMPMERAPEGVSVATAIGAEKGADGQAASVTISWKQGVTDVDMYPEVVPGLAVTGIKVSDGGKETRVDFRARVMEGQQVTAAKLPVLIVYTDADGHRRGFEERVDIHDIQGIMAGEKH